MSFPVLKGAAYALIQANDMVIHQGTTQTNERILNPESEHLVELPKHLRSFEDCVAYPPNQVYIGNMRPKALRDIPRPWYENGVANASRDGKFGEILPLDEFLGMMQVVDTFDLVLLEESFQATVREKLKAHPVLGSLKDLNRLEKNSADIAKIQELVDAHHAEGMYLEDKLVGCVKQAHEIDVALSHHVMFENIVSKASSTIALALLLHKTDLQAEDIDYIIECSEEACGDANQRGGGNFAKSIGEMCNCVNATGSDTRSFCAGPAHAFVEAAALVGAGVYDNVVIVAGGATAKMGMNSKDHVKKGMPVLEDCLGAFAIHISKNDGVSPIIRTDAVGRHKIGSGASPQAVIQAIVMDPLDGANLKLTDVDTFSAEMQNPEITEPAGAGDVPTANYKMIAALGVKRGDIDKADLAKTVESIGMPGFAPTQGHIPSGVPFLGFAREMIMSGEINRAMIIGKGSLFLGRLTNLFDGVSFMVEKNTGAAEDEGMDKDAVRQMIAEALRGFAQSLQS